MNLVLDAGNTVIKAAVFQRDILLKSIRIQKTELEKALQQLWSEYPQIDNFLVSNVSAEEVQLPDNIRDVKVLQIATAKMPFRNLYTTPQTLGNDRKALVAAAVKSYPTENVLVIDAGTCITYDIKTSKNEYLGGAISPGLKMRFKALHHFTGRLPQVQPQQPQQLIGDSTIASMNTGVVLGIAKEIDGFIEEYEAQWKNLVTIITGGDSQFLSGNLKNTIFANSNFLLEGLNHILEFNNSK